MTNTATPTLSRFLLECDISGASGTQTFYVDALDEAEALQLHADGKSEIYSSQCEVTDLGEPEVMGTTDLNDFGDAVLAAAPPAVPVQPTVKLSSLRGFAPDAKMIPDETAVEPKPYAYEFARSNGDDTYSIVIERGEPVQVGPARWESGPPRNPHPDHPVMPLYREQPSPSGVVGEAAFKNFHRALCARFGYVHDDQFWWRDLVSLEEHLANNAARRALTEEQIGALMAQAQDFADCIGACCLSIRSPKEIQEDSDRQADESKAKLEAAIRAIGSSPAGQAGVET